MSEIYVSTDVETNGPIPGDYSMLSLASAAFLPGSGSQPDRMVDTWSANLKRLPGACEDAGTMAFWRGQPDAWAELQRGRREPGEAMVDYAAWCGRLPGTPVFVAYPAGFDFMFVYWYLVHFGIKSPFSFSAVDMKTYAMAKLGTPSRGSTKRHWPAQWRNAATRPHTHVALDDAVAQGEQFMRMLRH